MTRSAVDHGGWTSRSAGSCHGRALASLLVPLDGSPLAECALPWAVAVALALPARLTLLRVLEKPALSSSTSHHHDAVDWEMRRVEAQSELARIDRELKARALTFITAHYVEATGDDTILSEDVPFLAGAPLEANEVERYARFAAGARRATLYRHCLAALERGRTAGPHALPLFGSGDWNDGTPLGSAERAECRIDSLAQSWAVLSAAADTARAAAAPSGRSICSSVCSRSAMHSPATRWPPIGPNRM